MLDKDFTNAHDQHAMMCNLTAWSYSINNSVLKLRGFPPILGFWESTTCHHGIKVNGGKGTLPGGAMRGHLMEKDGHCSR
jgi:hypothetical protein